LRFISSSEDFQTKLFEELYNNQIDIVAVPVPPIKLTSSLIAIDYFEYSNPIGEMSEHIASVTKPGVRSEFMYLLSYEPEVWFALITTLLCIALIMSIMRGSIKTFFSTLWQFSTILLSDVMTKSFNKPYEKMIVCIWLLMGGIVLFSAFTGCIYGFMIKKPPIQKIDSFDDLHLQWKDKQIIALDNGPFVDFVQNDKSDMAQDFKRRTEISPIENYFDDNFKDNAMKRLVSGECVLLHEYYALKHMEIYLNTLIEFNRKKGNKYGVDYHVSRSGGGTLPYFLLVKKDDKFNSTRSLNKA